eukprot:2632279-Amphidinium_carterae.1
MVPLLTQFLFTLRTAVSDNRACRRHTPTNPCWRTTPRLATIQRNALCEDLKADIDNARRDFGHTHSNGYT